MTEHTDRPTSRHSDRRPSRMNRHELDLLSFAFGLTTLIGLSWLAAYTGGVDIGGEWFFGAELLILGGAGLIGGLTPLFRGQKLP